MLLDQPTPYDQSPYVNYIEKVTQVRDEYFDMHQFDGPYCDCEKNYHHHMTTMRIVAEHRQVFY
jgi:hypothetical protein